VVNPSVMEISGIRTRYCFMLTHRIDHKDQQDRETSSRGLFVCTISEFIWMVGGKTERSMLQLRFEPGTFRIEINCFSILMIPVGFSQLKTRKHKLCYSFL
jgi:hypothetical protein